MVKQLKGFGLFHDLACVHDIHIVTDFRHNAHVMGDDQHAHAGFVPQLLHQAQDLGFNCHIQCGGGLIGNQQFGLAYHGHGNHHALAQAAGKLVRVAVIALFRFGDANTLEHFHHALLGFRLAHGRVMHQQRFAHLAAHLEHRVQAGHRLLKDHRNIIAADLAQLFIRKSGQVLIFKPDAAARHAAGVFQQAHNGFGGHAFAAAALPHQADDLALGNIQVQAIHRRDHAFFGKEIGVQAADFQNIIIIIFHLLLLPRRYWFFM